MQEAHKANPIVPPLTTLAFCMPDKTPLFCLPDSTTPVEPPPGFWPGKPEETQQICLAWQQLHPLLPAWPVELRRWLTQAPFPLQGLHDLLSLCRAEELVPEWEHPDLVAVLSVFGYSRFLSTRLIRHPEWISQLLAEKSLHHVRSESEMKQTLLDELKAQNCWTPLALKNLLRRFKYKEYYRLTVRDLQNLGPTEEILAELSAVTRTYLEWTLRGATLEAQHQELQTEQLTSPDFADPFLVLGMGKLGGQEINYSSDVDLIFVHDHKPITGEEDRDQRLRQKIARTFIEWCTDPTDEGFLARVDMRLRPGGDSSALVLPLDQVEAYYWSRASLWEQQALIKAAPVAGDPEIGDFFFRLLTPYIYRRSVDENLLREVEHIKQRIEQEHLRQSQLNVKLGVGGIREVEFFVQIFQLLYGGGRPELRTPNTLEALHALRQSRLLSEEDAATLRQCYLDLRRWEHRLQLIDEQQVHILPENQVEQQRFARLAGYCSEDPEADRQLLLQHLRDTMARVRSIFGGLFDQKHLEVEAALRNSTHFRNFTPEDSQLLESVARQLSPVLRRTGQDLLEKRFYRLFESIGAHLEHYPPLLKHPASWERLATIAATSETLWNHLLTNTPLLQRLQPTELKIDEAGWKQDLQCELDACPHEEEELDALRRFKHTLTFLLGSAELDGLLSYDQAREGLTLLAELVLQAAYRICLRDLQQRFGVPQHEDGTPANFAIVGMGKLGGQELTYHSDLDLIFLYSDRGETNGERSLGNQQFYAKLVQRLITTLSTLTSAGFAYKLDTRLRPSGNSGVLVTSLASYKEYHRNSQPWEHQALIKARVVGGDEDPAWREQIRQLLCHSVYEWSPPEDLAQQIAHLRQRKELELSGETLQQRNLKEGRGGLLDIEFLTQYLQLQHAQAHPVLQTPRTLSALEALEQQQLLSAEESHLLRNAYRWIRMIENYLRLFYDESVNTVNLVTMQQGPLEQLLRRHHQTSDDLVQELEKVTAAVREVYERIFQTQATL